MHACRSTLEDPTIRDGGVTASPRYYGDGAMVEQASAGFARNVAAPPVSPGLDRREVRVEVDFALRK